MSDNAQSAYRIQYLTGEENYDIWAIRMKDILTDQELWDYVDGTEKKPDDPALAKVWTKKDNQALTQIRLRVMEVPLVWIRDANTSKDAWQALATNYQPKGALAKTLLRRKLFWARCQEGADIEEHIRKLTQTRQQLASLGSKLDEDDFSAIIMTSLR